MRTSCSVTRCADWTGINWRKTHARASEALARMGLGDLDPRAPLSSISIAIQQLVAISRAMVTDSKVLILDEPTSSLDANEVEVLFGVIRRLRDQGVAILFVSHFLDQVYAISDRITVLRNGQFVGEYLKRDLDRTQLISKMIGKDFETLAGPRLQSADRSSATAPSRRSSPPRASAARARSSPRTSRSTRARSSDSPASSVPAAPSSRGSSPAPTRPTPARPASAARRSR